MLHIRHFTSPCNITRRLTTYYSRICGTGELSFYDQLHNVPCLAKSNMPKGKGEKLKSKQVLLSESPEGERNKESPVSLHVNNSILIRILAKPGAKQNSITGISADGIGVQISSPPVDGAANAELLKFMSSVLGVKKSAISLDKGTKSRTKVLILEPSAELSVERIEQIITSQLS